MKDRMILIRGNEVLVILLTKPKPAEEIQAPDTAPVIVEAGAN